MHYGTSTRLPPEKVMAKAVEYFNALGLKTCKRSPSTLTMEGGEGYVAVTLSLGTETEVDIIAHGFNAQVKAFLQRIG
jgi:hypothetical protein